MEYRIVWKRKNIAYTEYGGIDEVESIVAWLTEHQDDCELVSIEICEE